MFQSPKSCPKCAGCGRVADDDENTPWKYWAALPFPSDLAVRLGLVSPRTCQSCGGSGGRESESVCNAFNRLVPAHDRRATRCEDAEAAYSLELVTSLEAGDLVVKELCLFHSDGTRVRLWPVMATVKKGRTGSNG